MSNYIVELRKVIGNRPLIACSACVIVVDDAERILLQRRTDNGLWGLPGGAMEIGETLEQTARREAYEVGIGGNYLAHEHTVKYMRPHTWFPRITNREQWTPWMAGGGLDMRQRANERARQILAEHHPKPLTDDQEREIDRIAAEAQVRAIAQGPYTMSGT